MSKLGELDKKGPHRQRCGRFQCAVSGEDRGHAGLLPAIEGKRTRWFWDNRP